MISVCLWFFVFIWTFFHMKFCFCMNFSSSHFIWNIVLKSIFHVKTVLSLMLFWLMQTSTSTIQKTGEKLLVTNILFFFLLPHAKVKSAYSMPWSISLLPWDVNWVPPWCAQHREHWQTFWGLKCKVQTIFLVRNISNLKSVLPLVLCFSYEQFFIWNFCSCMNEFLTFHMKHSIGICFSYKKRSYLWFIFGYANNKNARWEMVCYN